MEWKYLSNLLARASSGDWEIKLTDEQAEMISDALKDRFTAPLLPEPGQSAVLASPSRYKTSALLADRVWVPPIFCDSDEPIPEEVKFWGASPTEAKTMAFALLVMSYDLSVERAPWGGLSVGPPAQAGEPPKWTAPEQGDGEERTLRALADVLHDEIWIVAEPIFSSRAARDAAFEPGKTELVAWSLQNLEVVDEDSLTWDQVLQFRSDEEAIAKYRRFRHWLDSSMLGKPLSYVEDAINLKLEDYRWALRRHGLECASGVLSAFQNPRVLAASAAALGGSTMLSGAAQLIAAIAGGTMALGEVSLQVSRVILEYRRLKTTSEIAFVHEISKLHQP